MPPILYPFALLALLVLLPVLSGCIAVSVFLGYAMLVLGSSFRRGVGSLVLLYGYVRGRVG